MNPGWLGAEAGGDAALLVQLAHGGADRGPRDRHRLRLGREQAEREALGTRLPREPFVDEQGGLVRRGRALVGRCDDGDQHTAAGEAVERVAQAQRGVQLVELVRHAGRAWQRLQGEMGARGQDQRIGMHPIAGDLDHALHGIHGHDLGASELETMARQGREAAADLLGPAPSGDHPRVAGSQRHLGPAIHHEDAMGLGQQRAQAARRGDAAESGADDDRGRGGRHPCDLLR